MHWLYSNCGLLTGNPKAAAVLIHRVYHITEFFDVVIDISRWFPYWCVFSLLMNTITFIEDALDIHTYLS